MDGERVPPSLTIAEGTFPSLNFSSVTGSEALLRLTFQYHHGNDLAADHDCGGPGHCEQIHR
jgi:hypothetical protein